MSTTQTQSQAALVAANMFSLAGGDLHVSYSTRGIDGKPHFSYQDPSRSLSFTGDEIRTMEGDLATVVSVTIVRTVDAGSTSFSPGAARERGALRQCFHPHGRHHHASCVLDRPGAQSRSTRFLLRDGTARHRLKRRVLIRTNIASCVALVSGHRARSSRAERRACRIVVAANPTERTRRSSIHGNGLPRALPLDHARQRLPRLRVDRSPRHGVIRLPVCPRHKLSRPPLVQCAFLSSICRCRRVAGSVF
jgi:hypothetical protein